MLQCPIELLACLPQTIVLVSTQLNAALILQPSSIPQLVCMYHTDKRQDCQVEGTSECTNVILQPF